MEHVFGHCGTLPTHRGHSWTFMDNQMDPERLKEKPAEAGVVPSSSLVMLS